MTNIVSINEKKEKVDRHRHREIACHLRETIKVINPVISTRFVDHINEFVSLMASSVVDTVVPLEGVKHEEIDKEHSKLMWKQIILACSQVMEDIKNREILDNEMSINR